MPQPQHNLAGIEASSPADRPSDQLVCQHLGAAVMLCWTGLPLAARERILHQAGDMIGLAPIPQIRQEIVKLLLRHAKAQWRASLSMMDVPKPRCAMHRSLPEPAIRSAATDAPSTRRR